MGEVPHFLGFIAGISETCLKFTSNSWEKFISWLEDPQKVVAGSNSLSMYNIILGVCDWIKKGEQII